MTISYYNGNEYKNRSELSQLEGFLLASAVSSGIMSPLVYIGQAFEKQAIKEHANNHLYKDTFEKISNMSEFKDKGVTVVPAQFKSFAFPDEANGRNAFFNAKTKEVVINTDKMCIVGTHEFGHAWNHLHSKIGKLLQKMRYPGYAIAALMEYFAIFSRTKPKDAPKTITDRIEDNCGLIAFLAMTPTAIEEALASKKGIEFARNAGLSEPLIKNMKKILTKAWMTYGGRAVLGGLAVGASRLIMDKFTRPKKIENNSALLF